MIGQDQLRRIFAPLTGDADPHVRDTLAGNVNTIFKVEANGRTYGLRIRTQEQVYRYEADLIKEVFVSWLLDPAHAGASDADKARVLERLHAARRGPGLERGSIEPAGVAYDCSREIIPHPYFVYEWVDGEPLWNTPNPRAYAAAGAALARLHHVRFEAVYADFFGIGKTPLAWPDRFRTAMEKERNEAAGRGLDPRLVRTFGQLLPSTETPIDPAYGPCLVHNDFAPANVLMQVCREDEGPGDGHTDEGRLAAVIDWDNAVVDLAPLDFVKMKHWAMRASDGRLTSDPALFVAFVTGYGDRGTEIVESRMFACCEALWLLRVFNFEASKRERGLGPAPGYPPAAHYAGALAQVLDRLHREHFVTDI